MFMEFAFAKKFPCNPAYLVCVDFNGRTAYAYLCRDCQVLSTVWLYNAVPAPGQAEWGDDPLSLPPYLNSREYVSEEAFQVPESKEKIEIFWFRLNGDVQALVYIHDDLHATMLANERVGCCRLAKKNGPLARKLVPEF